MAKQLASVRTNLSFSFEKEKTELIPLVEVILLTYKPEYFFTGKDQIAQKKALDETRITLSREGLSQLLFNLQMALNQMQSFEQMAVGLNEVVAAMKKDN